MQGTRRDQSCFGFCPSETRLLGFMPMFAANPLVTNVTKVVRIRPVFHSNPSEGSTANKSWFLGCRLNPAQLLQQRTRGRTPDTCRRPDSPERGISRGFQRCRRPTSEKAGKVAG